MSNHPIAGLIVVIAVCLFTMWFGALMLKAVDILYKPSVKKWMHNRPVWHKPPPDEFCFVDSKEDCHDPFPTTDNVLSVDDEYLAKLEVELRVLKAMKGFTGPDPKGKLKKKRLIEDPDNLSKCASIRIDEFLRCFYHCLNHFFQRTLKT